MAAGSLTRTLHRIGRSSGNSILFSRQSSSATDNHNHRGEYMPNLTYEQCWKSVADHRQWLKATIDEQLHTILHDPAGATTTKGKIEDVVVAYLGDNSPDLLLSVLACIDLTTSYDALVTDPETTRKKRIKVLPAMINSRWTPAEMERALRPSHEPENYENHMHVTILLYGQGYERAAMDASDLMNQSKMKLHRETKSEANSSHNAVALSLPEPTEGMGRHSGENIASRSSNIFDQNEPLEEIGKFSGGDDSNVTDSDAIILFTSGTSSPRGAKGVRLSHRSLLIQARAKTQEPCRYDRQTAIVATTVPWFHVGGISSALAVVLGGGCFVFPPADEHASDGKKGFQPGGALRSLQPCSLTDGSTSVAANTLVVVPAMLHAIAEYAEKDEPCSLPSVKLILVGGQSIGKERLYSDTRRLFPKARIVQTYACTEAGSSITFEDLGWAGSDDDEDSIDFADVSNPELLNGATCVGSSPPHIQIGIFTNTRNNTVPNERPTQAESSMLPPGQLGIIGTRGPHVMSGYWNRGENGANIPDPNNDWMLTNDLGFINPRSGKLFFCGRANDVIRTGGESVLATEVERILDTYEGLVESAVFAFPDEKFGEAVCAAVVLEKSSLPTDSGALEDAELVKRIRNHFAKCQVAGFKRPRRVFLLQALPRNSSGKVLKHAIMKLCARHSKQMSRL